MEIVHRALYGYGLGPIFYGQALVLTDPLYPDQTGPVLRPSTGSRSELLYGIALCQQLSHYQLASRTDVVSERMAGMKIGAAVSHLIPRLVDGSEHVTIDGAAARRCGEPTSPLKDRYPDRLVEGQVLSIRYQYQYTYQEYVETQGDPVFTSFDMNRSVQVPVGREGIYRTQFYVPKSFEPGSRVRLAQGGRLSPVKKASKGLPNVRVISPPSSGDPFILIEIY